jgi:hypothetical protein
VQEYRYWCSEGCGFVDGPSHRCEQWTAITYIPMEAVQAIRAEARAEALREAADRPGNLVRLVRSADERLRATTTQEPAFPAPMVWQVIDKNNIPKGEVLAANFNYGTRGYNEKIIGYLGDDLVCENEHEVLNNCSHYIKLHEYKV